MRRSFGLEWSSRCLGGRFVAVLGQMRNTLVSDRPIQFKETAAI